MINGFTEQFIRKYSWWEEPDEAMRIPQRFYARVMDIGTYDDVKKLEKTIGLENMRNTLNSAVAGQFRPRSWVYWQIILNNADEKNIPEMPRRKYT